MNTAVLGEMTLPLLLTLVHFLWQGAAIGLLALLGALVLRKAAAATRYKFFFTLLLLMALCPLATFAWLRQAAPTPAPTSMAAIREGEAPLSRSPQEGEAPLSRLPREGERTREQAPAQASPPSTPDTPIQTGDVPSAGQTFLSAQPAPVPGTDAPAETPAREQTGMPAPQWPDSSTRAEPLRETAMQSWLDQRERLEHYAPYVLLAYALGVALMWMRLLLALHGGQRLRRRAHPLDDPALLEALQRYARLLGLKAAPAVAFCERVVVPTVVGVLRPLILLPVTVHTGLTPQQLELLLCHELAHIRRYDHLLNIIQAVIESFLFFHPAVLWVSRRIRIEREHCCDDLVLQHGGESLTYAESLLKVAEQSRGYALEALLLSAAGKPSQLSRRIYRILNVPAPALRLTRVGLFALLLTGALGVLAVVQVAALQETPNAAQATPNPTSPTSPTDPTNQEPPAPTALAQQEFERLRDILLTEPDPWLRKLAAQQIAAAGPEAVDVLLNALQRSDAAEARNLEEEYAVRQAAARSLGQIGDPRAIPPLASALRHSLLHEAAGEALAAFPPEAVEAYLAAALEGDNEIHIFGALHVLSYRAAPGDTERLLQKLAEMEWSTDEVVALLKTLPREELLQQAEEMLASEAVPSRVTGIYVMSHLGMGDLPEALLTLLHHDDALIRLHAVLALANYEASAPGPVVQVLTQDPLHSVRARAATTLLALGWKPTTPEEEAAFQVALENFDVAATLGKAAVAPLLVAMRAAPPPDEQANNNSGRGRAFARTAALKALARAAGPEDAPSITPALEDAEVEVRKEALRALAQLNNPEVAAAIIPLLKHWDESVRATAAATLGSLQAESAVEALAGSLRDLAIGHAAAAALGHINTPEAQAALLAVVQDDGGDAQVRLAAAQGLANAGDLAIAAQLEQIAEQIDPDVNNRPALRTDLQKVAAYIRGATAHTVAETEQPTPERERAEETTTQVEATIAPEKAQTPGRVGPAMDDTVEVLLQQLQDEDYWLRKVAVQKLGERLAEGLPLSAELLQLLIPALKDESEDVRVAAAELFTEHRDPQVIKHLVAALRDQHAAVRAAMAEALVKYDVDQVLELLRIAAEDSAWEVRRGAIAALQRIPSAASAQLLVDMLARVNTGRGAMLRSLFDILKPALLEFPRELVVPRLLVALQSDSLDMAAGAADILGETGGEEVLAALLETAQREDGAGRHAAAAALGKLEGEGAAEALANLLDHPDYFVRRHAAQALSERGISPETPEDSVRLVSALGQWEQLRSNPAAAPVLQEILQMPLAQPEIPSFHPDNRVGGVRVVRDPEPVFQNALETLVSLPGDHVPFLLQLLEQKTAEADKLKVIEALGSTKDARALPALVELVTAESPSIRMAAVWNLQRFQDPTAVQTIYATLSDPAADVRETAMNALAESESTEAVSLLTTVFLNSSEHWEDAIGGLLAHGTAGAKQLGETIPQVDLQKREGVLNRLPDESRDSIPVLLEILRHSPELFQETMRRLNFRTPAFYLNDREHQELAVILREYLQNSSVDVRTQLAAAIHLYKLDQPQEPLLEWVQSLTAEQAGVLTSTAEDRDRYESFRKAVLEEAAPDTAQ